MFDGFVQQDFAGLSVLEKKAMAQERIDALGVAFAVSKFAMVVLYTLWVNPEHFDGSLRVIIHEAHLHLAAILAEPITKLAEGEMTIGHCG